MRITNISVEKLFGMFDYSIDLNLDEKVTILIGPNGYGKSTILKLLSDLFDGKLSELFKVPYSKLKIVFEHETVLEITKSINYKKKDDKFPNLIVKIIDSENSPKSINLSDIDFERNRDLYYFATEELGVDVLDRQTVRILRYGGKLQNLDNYYKNFDKIYDSIPKSIQDKSYKEHRRASHPNIHEESIKTLKTIKDLLGSVDVHFVKTQRLVTYVPREGSREWPPSSSWSEATARNEKEIPVVNLYSLELAKEIEKSLAESSQVSQQLDSTFPARIITNSPNNPGIKTFDELILELESLRDKRIHLRDTGILVELGDEVNVPARIEDESRRSFLQSVLVEYVNDTQEKLRVFDDLARRIELLKKIINSRFSFKRLEINKDKGFLFKTSLGEELSPDSLSSGEQHEVVMFYNFLFKVNKGSLLLIDEPELSLHIEWQQKFLRDLIEIAKLVGFDVLIATHAPSIIEDYWHLTYDLGEFKYVPNGK